MVDDFFYLFEWLETAVDNITIELVSHNEHGISNIEISNYGSTTWQLDNSNELMTTQSAQQHLLSSQNMKNKIIQDSNKAQIDDICPKLFFSFS